MKHLTLLLILITILLFCSCSSGKSIEGKKWYKGWKYEDVNGNLIPQCRSKRYRGFTKG